MAVGSAPLRCIVEFVSQFSLVAAADFAFGLLATRAFSLEGRGQESIEPQSLLAVRAAAFHTQLDLFCGG